LNLWLHSLCSAWQVLRTQCVDSSSGPQQTIKPASAVQISNSMIETNGSAVLLHQPSGGCAIHASSTLAAAWRQAAAAPFDLYNDTLIRIQVTYAVT
jgi:hypothetical protein